VTGGAWPLGWAALALVLSTGVLITAGVRFTHVVDRLADRTGIGEALAGAVLLGATTSLPGLVTTITAAAEGDASFAVSNGIGGIAAQTAFLAIADITYRKVNLEHAAASVPNLLQTTLLVGLIALVLVGATGPDIAILRIHPVTPILFAAYLYGLHLTRKVGNDPAWRPQLTPETVEDEPDETPADESLQTLWAQFLVLAGLVACVGWVVGRAGLSIVDQTDLSGPLVAALFTAVVTSMPELVTTLSAVRMGALTLAVADIVGGNTFDVLFVGVADIVYGDASIYQAIDQQTLFLMAVTILMTAVFAAGLLRREKRGIGFEGVGILVVYVAAVVTLVVW
jgi:cation:H+ antiporter